MKAWGIFIASWAVLLATSAGAQEKPRLGFKDIYLGMAKEALRPIVERGCREDAAAWASALRKNEPLLSEAVVAERQQEQIKRCLANPPPTLPQRYWHVGSILVIMPTVVIKDDKVGGIRLSLMRDDFRAMEAAFTEKYGPPLFRTIEVVKNKLGAEFNSEVLTWELKEGTILMKERSLSLDSSEVFIASYAFLDAAEKERKSRAKKDAQGL